jgi:hypothetical protein
LDLKPQKNCSFRRWRHEMLRNRKNAAFKLTIYRKMNSKYWVLIIPAARAYA